MAQMKTPGVYIVEKDAFGNGVVEVATAVPAFIGYTEKASNGGKSLLNKPTRITSIGEFTQFFGGAPKYQFDLKEISKEKPKDKEDKSKAGGEVKKANNVKTTEVATVTEPDFSFKDKNYSLNSSGQQYYLFNAMRLFFQNGGGPCFIVSVGSYNDDIEIGKLMDNGIPPLLKEEEPTMVLVPEAIRLKKDECIKLQQAVLGHCEKMQSRVGVLDIYDGYKERNHPDGDVIDDFRNSLGVNALSYGMAYYPWLETTIVADSELGITNFTKDSLDTLKNLIMYELKVPAAKADDKANKKSSDSGKKEDTPPTKADEESAKIKELRLLLGHISNIYEDAYTGPKIPDLNKTLIAISPTYNNLLMDVKKRLNILAPAAAMAGIYTLVDNTRGVWKAPANVSLNSVVRPVVNISHDEQQDLNVTLHGKSVNAIRPFIGEGVLVWGARTLDGNSKDWRYINVRRTMIMLEQSIKIAAKAYVFEPNDSNTWTTMKSMIDSFLYNQWKSGALVGSTPEEAYLVRIGLGVTMTADDILEGILKISVLLAISRPAEFIEITFQQQMQKS